MLKYILAFLVLSIVIMIHEFGHFIVAKASGVVVKEFSLGMGPRILKFTKNGTMYSLKLFLFGGSCQMLGEDEDVLPSTESTKEEGSSQTVGEGENSEPEGSFNSKSVWKRIAIIAAGPIFNFLLAFVFSIVLIGTVGYEPCIVYNVDEDSAAYEAGLEPGDVIKEINGADTTFYGDYSMYLLLNEGTKIKADKELELTIERDGREMVISYIPEYVDEDVYQMGIYYNPEDALISEVMEDSAAEAGGLKKGDIIVSIDGTKIVNGNDITDLIQASDGNEMDIVVKRDGEEVALKVTAKTVHSTYYDYGFNLSGERLKVGPLETVGYSFKQVGYWIKQVFNSFRLLFKGVATVNDMSGPVGIVSAIGDVVEESKSDGAFYVFLNLLNWMIMISANLGVMNLLPIPALDGGRLTFLFIEAVRGKPISREKEGMVHFVGIVLLMILMVVIMFNDIRKLF